MTPIPANMARVARSFPAAVTDWTSPYPTVVNVITAHHNPSYTEPKTSGCIALSRWYMPNPAVITMMPVPANSAPASSMAKRNALASFATALVRLASFAVVTTRRNRRKARSALKSNPVNAQSGRMARKSTIPMKLNAYFLQFSVRRTVSGDGLGGVHVTVYGEDEEYVVATNATGYYSVDHLHAGDYSVTISGYGTEYSFDVTSKSVSVGLRETATVSFEGQEP